MRSIFIKSSRLASRHNKKIIIWRSKEVCKQMMKQRQEIEADILRELKSCESSIRNNGKMVIPHIIVDTSELFIANKTYFEQNGFCFDDSTRVENGAIKHYAIMRPIFNGMMAEAIRMRMQEAQKDFIMCQRHSLQKDFAKSVSEEGSRKKAQVIVDMREISCDNKSYFEGEGYYFVPKHSCDGEDSVFLAWLRRY